MAGILQLSYCTRVMTNILRRGTGCRLQYMKLTWRAWLFEWRTASSMKSISMSLFKKVSESVTSKTIKGPSKKRPSEEIIVIIIFILFEEITETISTKWKLESTSSSTAFMSKWILKVKVFEEVIEVEIAIGTPLKTTVFQSIFPKLVILFPLVFIWKNLIGWKQRKIIPK